MIYCPNKYYTHVETTLFSKPKCVLSAPERIWDIWECWELLRQRGNMIQQRAILSALFLCPRTGRKISSGMSVCHSVVSVCARRSRLFLVFLHSIQSIHFFVQLDCFLHLYLLASSYSQHHQPTYHHTLRPRLTSHNEHDHPALSFSLMRLEPSPLLTILV